MRSGLVSLGLELVTGRVSEAVAHFELRDPEPLLVRARLGDLYRDEELVPLPSGDFDRAVEDLDVAAWRRLAVCVDAAGHPYMRAGLAELLAGQELDRQVCAGFIEFAGEPIC